MELRNCDPPLALAEGMALDRADCKSAGSKVRSVQHYVYDASGERVLKGSSAGQAIHVNKEQRGGTGKTRCT